MKGKTFLIFVVSILFGNTQPVFSDDLKTVLRLTFEKNNQLIVERKKLLAQREQLIQLRANLLPNITANISRTNTWDLDSNSETNSSLASISADYTIYDGNLRANNIASEKHLLRMSEFSLTLNEQKVLLSAIKAYLDVLRDRRLVDLSKKNVAVITKQLSATQSRFDFGELTRTDVSQASAALSAAESTLAARQGNLELSNSIFELIIGSEPIHLVEVDDIPPLPSSLKESKKIALKYNPAYQEAITNEDMARANLEASKSIRSPNLRISSSISEGQGRSAQIRIVGSLPIFNGGKNESVIRESSKRLEVAISRSNLSRLNVIQSVVASWSELEVSKAMIPTRIRQVEANNLAYQGVREEARLGTRTTLDVLDAEQALMNAEIDLATAKSNRLSAAFNLLSAIGKLDPETLNLKLKSKNGS